MPFRDREWEDFQRDCDLFPAYTDYIYGVDSRPEVADEPGLHPQICKPPPLPRQRIYGLPQTHHVATYDPVCDATRASPYTVSGMSQQRYQDYQESQSITRKLMQMLPNAPPTSLLRQDPSVESLLPTPTPAPRTLHTPGPPMALLRPGELAADPVYSFIPQQERMVANKNIIQAWSIMNSDTVPAQKAKAMGYLKSMSRMAAAKKQEYQDHEISRLEALEAEAQRKAEFESSAQQGYQYDDRWAGLEIRQAEAEAERQAEWESGLSPNTYNIRDISQLPAYVQARLTQLWTCTEMVALQGPPADEIQHRMYQQAQQYLLAFKQSVPPEGRPWVGLVVDEMLKIRRQGGDPLTVLETIPSVESVYQYGSEHFRGA